MISCVFCCKQDSDIYFTFTNKDILHLWCTELLKRSFLLKQPFTGFPTCGECKTLHDRVVALNDEIQKCKGRILTMLDSFKDKVVISDSNAKLTPLNNFNIPWNNKLGENCKILRHVLLGKELSQVVIGASLLKHPVNPDPPPTDVHPIPSIATLNLDVTSNPNSHTNTLEPQITSQIQNLLSYASMPSLSTSTGIVPLSVRTSELHNLAPAPPILKTVTVNPTPFPIFETADSTTTIYKSSKEAGRQNKIKSVTHATGLNDANKSTNSDLTYKLMDAETGHYEGLSDLDENESDSQNCHPSPGEVQQAENQSDDSVSQTINVTLKSHRVKRKRDVQDEKDAVAGTKNRKPILGNFPCEFCSKQFTLEDRLVLHLQTMHSAEPTEDKYNCFDCDKKFYSMLLLERHVETHETIYSQQMTCPFCPKTQQSKLRPRYNLVIHIQKAHESKLQEDEKPHRCPKCGKRFMSKLLLSRHFTRHVKLEATHPLVCDICDARYPKGCYALLKDHERTQHFLGDKWRCRLCPAIFRDRPNLHRHEREIHPELAVYQCDQCVNKYTREEFLKTHVLAEHPLDTLPAGPFECAACGRSYLLREKLKFHLEVHTGESISTDLLWNKVVRMKGDLSNLTPPASHPYECNLCLLRYRTKRNLDRHQMECDPKALRKAQRCSECGKEFQGEGWFGQKKRHQEEEHGNSLKSHENTCLCYQCGKTVTKLGLNKHLSRCQDPIGLNIMRKSRHNYHRNIESARVRTGKPGECYFCGFKFKHIRFLPRHMLSHTKECSLECKLCGKKYCRLSNWLRHRRDVHNIKSTGGGRKSKKKVQVDLVEAITSNVMVMDVEAEVAVEKAVEIVT